MRVNSQALDAFTQSSVNRTAQTRGVESRQAERVASSDPSDAAVVAISKEARDLALKNDAPIRTDKVQGLKDAISGGTFQVNSQMIARRVIDYIA